MERFVSVGWSTLLSMVVMFGATCAAAQSPPPAAWGERCAAGDAEACARQYTEPRPVDAARFAQLAQLCRRGNPYACAHTGTLRLAGQGTPRDERAAIPLLERGCAGGVAFACVSLGALYADDYEPRVIAADSARTTRFFTRARDLLRGACERGDADACETVANLYWHGRGFPRDDAQRWVFLGRACELGGSSACAQLGTSRWRGAPGIEHDPIQAARDLLRACELGDENACHEAPQIAVDEVIERPPGVWADRATLEALLRLAQREQATGGPRPETAFAAIGATQLMLGRPDEARAAFESGLGLTRDSDGVRAPYVLGLALALEARGSMDAARVQYARFIELAAGTRSRAWLMLPRAQGIDPDAALRFARARLAQP